MRLITLFALIAIIILAVLTAVSVASGVGLLLIFCVAAIFCVITGALLLIKLLAKGLFSILKCVIFLALLLIPVVNVIVLAALAVYAVKMLITEC